VTALRRSEDTVNLLLAAVEDPEGSDIKMKSLFQVMAGLVWQAAWKHVVFDAPYNHAVRLLGCRLGVTGATWLAPLFH
jgi:hypothetical protein